MTVGVYIETKRSCYETCAERFWS